ncbi:MAG: hypothetical protein AAF478_14625, partial [Pseudomonadota bacterium]
EADIAGYKSFSAAYANERDPMNFFTKMLQGATRLDSSDFYKLNRVLYQAAETNDKLRGLDDEYDAFFIEAWRKDAARFGLVEETDKNPLSIKFLYELSSALITLQDVSPPGERQQYAEMSLNVIKAHLASMISRKPS